MKNSSRKFGVIIFQLFVLIIFVTLPAAFIELPRLVRTLVIALAYFWPSVGVILISALYIWACVIALGQPIDTLSIVLFVSFGVYILYHIAPIIIGCIAFRDKDSYGKFLDECEEVISEYGFDSSYLAQLKAMVKETKKSKQPLPDEPVRKLACTCVFNSVAQDLMLHKYNLSDLGFNPLGEIYLSSLSKLGADMVSLCYVSKEEMNELLDNIVRVSLEYASKDIVEHFCNSVRIG